MNGSSEKDVKLEDNAFWKCSLYCKQMAKEQILIKQRIFDSYILVLVYIRILYSYLLISWISQAIINASQMQMINKVQRGENMRQGQ